MMCGGSGAVSDAVQDDAAAQLGLEPGALGGHEHVGVGHVEALNVDVYAEPDRFFSYRKSQHNGDPDYARLISAIALV